MELDIEIRSIKSDTDQEIRSLKNKHDAHLTFIKDEYSLASVKVGKLVTLVGQTYSSGKSNLSHLVGKPVMTVEFSLTVLVEFV